MKFYDIIKMPYNRGYKVIAGYKPLTTTRTKKQAIDRIKEHQRNMTKQEKIFAINAKAYREKHTTRNKK